MDSNNSPVNIIRLRKHDGYRHKSGPKNMFTNSLWWLAYVQNQTYTHNLPSRACGQYVNLLARGYVITNPMEATPRYMLQQEI